MKENRKLHLDLLRIVACLSVIMLHSASQYWYELPVTEGRWVVYNAWDAVSRFGVPVFVMISGMLFLSREGQPDLKKLYCGNILRLAVAYGVWSIVYGLWDCRGWSMEQGATLYDYATEIVLGRYHLWFIPMLVGIYILLPVIKTFTDHCSKKGMEYFLLIFLVLQIGRSTLEIIRLPVPATVLVELVHVEMACSYVGYFVLGYYLYRYPLSHVWQVRLYFMAGLSLLAAPVISILASRYYQNPEAATFDSYSVFTFLVTVAVFVFFQEKLSKIQWKGSGKKLLAELSANTFGVYLLHVLVIEWLQAAGVDSMKIAGVLVGETAVGCALGIPVLALLSYLISNVLISLLRRVPLLGRYVC